MSANAAPSTTTTTSRRPVRLDAFTRRRFVVFLALLIMFVSYHLLPMSLSLETAPSMDTSPVAAVSAVEQRHHWWDEYVDRIARPFLDWNGTEWCVIDKHQSSRILKSAHNFYGVGPNQRIKGLMLGKVHKAASTTSASVTLRIAYRAAQRRLATENMTIDSTGGPMCQAHFFHDFTTLNYHSKRDPARSFLWTTVRIPHARSESAFYYYVPQNLYDDDDKHLEFLERSRGHQVRYLRQRNISLFEYGGNVYQGKEVRGKKRKNINMGIPGSSMIHKDPDKLAFEHIQKEILEFYDFIAVTERWTESMAVLKLLLPDVRYSDLVALRVKESGGYVSQGGGCKFIQQSTSSPSPKIESYLNGRFRETNADYLLYAAVNRSLDITIERLGKSRVEEGAKHIGYLQALAQDKCQSEVIGACAENGQLRHPSERNCYVKDFGCAHQCLDRVLPD